MTWSYPFYSRVYTVKVLSERADDDDYMFLGSLLSHCKLYSDNNLQLNANICPPIAMRWSYNTNCILMQSHDYTAQTCTLCPLYVARVIAEPCGFYTKRIQGYTQTWYMVKNWIKMVLFRLGDYYKRESAFFIYFRVHQTCSLCGLHFFCSTYKL